jgi:hypothetical protein
VTRVANGSTNGDDLTNSPSFFFVFVQQHRHRVKFRIDLNSCNDGSGSTAVSSVPSSEIYNHRAAFAAHGFFATLAFAVIIPFAMFAAWFRTLIPKWWIYIHVFCNCIGFFFTVISVATAFGGMMMRGNAGGNDSHLSIAHHWTGLFLFIFVIFQVVSGFRRPPVDKESTSVYDAKNTSCCPSTKREYWHFFHRLTALTVISIGLFQLHTGLTLFSQEYGNGSNSSIVVFWIWISFLIVWFSYVKLATMGKEKRRPAQPNLMPQRAEEDYEEDYIPSVENSQYRDDDITPII